MLITASVQASGVDTRLVTVPVQTPGIVLTPDWLQFLEFHCHHADHSSWNLIAITQITVPGIDAVGTRLCQHFEL